MNREYTQFHDRAVVASLKHVGWAVAHVTRDKFHDRAVVASLKPLEVPGEDTLMPNSTTARSWPH